MFLFRNFLGFLLGQFDHQDTILVFGLHILFREVVAYVEAALHGAGVPFLTEQLAVFLFLILQVLLRGDSQITILQIQMDFVLLQAGQINGQLVAFICFLHVGLHHPGGVLAIQYVFRTAEAAEEITVEVIKQIHHIFTENSRQESTHIKPSILLIRFRSCFGSGESLSVVFGHPALSQALIIV